MMMMMMMMMMMTCFLKSDNHIFTVFVVRLIRIRCTVPIYRARLQMLAAWGKLSIRTLTHIDVVM